VRSIAASGEIAANTASAPITGSSDMAKEVRVRPNVATNGKRRPPRPRIELVSTTASESEAAAIVAAVEQFLADTAPVPSGAGESQSPWLRTALEEGISARQVSARGWGLASG
jgi:hypothetical protein